MKRLGNADSFLNILLTVSVVNLFSSNVLETRRMDGRNRRIALTLFENVQNELRRNCLPVSFPVISLWQWQFLFAQKLCFQVKSESWDLVNFIHLRTMNLTYKLINMAVSYWLE